MKRLVSIFLVLCICFSFVACGANSDSKENTKPNVSDTSKGLLIVDMAGREVYIPEDTKNNTVATTYGAATPFFVTLGISDRVLATTTKNKGFMRMADSTIIKASDIGNLTLDAEALANLSPSICVYKTTNTDKVEMTTKLGIPSLTICAETPDEVIGTYEMLGKAFGVEERASEIVSYIKAQLDEVDRLAARIPKDKKVTAVCMGSELGQIAGKNMLQNIMLERCGATTIVTEETVGDQIWVTVGTERVFDLNPDCLFITSSNILNYSLEELKADPTWAGLKALKTNRVYLIPAQKDSWDMPGPGFVLAMYYMLNSMYPDILPDDVLQQKIDEYYLLLYGRTFTAEEIGY